MMDAPSTGFVNEILPGLDPCGHLWIGEGDVVVHAPGFEDRTMGMVEAIRTQGPATAILLDYRPFNVDNKLQEVRRELLTRGVIVRDKDLIEYDRFKPDDFEARLLERLIDSGACRVFVDISTMSKLAIMLILNVCRNLAVDVCVSYVEARQYGPSQQEFEQAKITNAVHRPTLQVFTGVHGVIRVDSLKSVAMQGHPTAVLTFMSFNDSLTQVLLNTVFPGRLFLINGRPPIHDWREEATAWIHDQVRREWEEDNPVARRGTTSTPLPRRVVSTLDYRECVALLLQLYWRLSASHRMLLAPAGSKMQAVGCFLVKALHPDIHVEYPSPEGFRHVYSSGIGDRWLLRLGKLSDLLLSVSAAEQKEYLQIPVASFPDPREHSEE